jgi:ABC-2 type transport system permease protein
MRAMRDAALGGSAWAEIALTLALGVVYVGLAIIFLRYFERRARAAATLALT